MAKPWARPSSQVLVDRRRARQQNPTAPDVGRRFVSMNLSTPTNANLTDSVRRSRVLAALLFALVWIVFWPVGGNDFVNYDTPGYLTENTLVNQGFSAEGVKAAFTTGQSHLWHPLTTLSHMLDCELFGLEPRGHHLMNVGIHALTSALLIPLLFGLTGRLWPCVFAAAFFALHPLRVESVAWAAERKDTLCALFWFLTTAVYARHVRAPSRRSHALLLLVFALGVMTKPVFVTLPCALLLLDFWPLNRIKPGGDSGGDWRRFCRRNAGLLKEKAPLFLGSIFLCVMTIRAQQSAAIASLEEIDLSSRFANAPVAYIGYLSMLVWPDNLAVFYPLPLNGWGWGTVAVAAVFLISITALAIRFRGAFPYAFFGWFWFLGVLVPNIGLIQAGIQSMADRFAYLPSLGIAVLIAWGAADLAARRRWNPGLLLGIALVWLGALSLATRMQIAHWKDSVALFSRAIDSAEGNPIAHHNLATALLERGRVDEAYEHFMTALAYNPGHVEANTGAAIIAAGYGRLNEAEDRYRAALSTDAGNVKAANNLGNILVSTGRAAEGIDLFERVLSAEPDNPDALNNHGLALAELGDESGAINRYRQAIAGRPDYYRARQNLAVALAARGDHGGAVVEYRATLELKPDLLQAHAGLGISLRALGRNAEAIDALIGALDLEPGFALARFELIDALVYEGRFREAIGELQTAIRGNSQDLGAPLRLGWIYAACSDDGLRDGRLAGRIAADIKALSDENDPGPADLMAAALAEQGRFSEAAAIAENALKLAEASQRKALASAIRDRLRAYRGGTPFRLEKEFP